MTVSSLDALPLDQQVLVRRIVGNVSQSFAGTFGAETIERFVIDSLDQLLAETQKDFGPIYDRLKGAEDLPIEAILPADKVFTRGTQAYARAGGRLAKKVSAA